MIEDQTPSRSSQRMDSLQQTLYRRLIAPQASLTEPGANGRSLLLALLSLVFLAGILAALAFMPGSLGSFLPLIVIAAVSYALSRTASFNFGALLFSYGLVLYAYAGLVLGFSPGMDVAVVTYIPIALVLASAILSSRAFLVLGITAAVLTFGAPVYSRVPVGNESLRLGGIVLSIAALLYAIRLYRENVERSRLQELRGSNLELQSMRAELESRVEARTLELEASTGELAGRSAELAKANQKLERRASQFEAISLVSRSIASIRDLQSLLPGIASVISRNFGFYHVGIFLLDEDREYAVLSAANSEGGQRMLARQHRLRVGQEGIVGFVSARGEPRIALDVGEDAVFFNNPDLPDTHSEVALPLKKGTSVVGVLDVQSTDTDAFSMEDVDLLGLLADQVSLAIENARLFDETQRSLAEAEAFSRQYLREGWGRLASEHQLVGFRYDKTGAAPLSSMVEVPLEAAPTEPGEFAEVVGVPIELRGALIGNLVVQAPAGKKWTQDELDLIKAVAERVALSAENARLFEETSRRAERERMVSEITSRIRSSNDPNEMIKMAVQELKSALGVTRVEVVPQRVSSGPQSGE